MFKRIWELQKLLPYLGILPKFYSTGVKPIVFQRLLECDYYTALKTVKNIKELQMCDPQLAEENINLLEKYGITKKDILNNANILLLDPFVAENHLYFLEEGGFKKIDSEAVSCFMSVIKKNRNVLEAYGYIAQDDDVIGSLLSHVEKCRPYVSPPPYNITKNDTLAAMSSFVLKYYLSWRLDVDPQKLNQKTLINFRCKSFRILSKTLKLLENDLGFSKEDILKHSYIANCHHRNIENILSSIQNLGGQNIRVVLKNNPKILLVHFKSILKIAAQLKVYEIPDSTISNNFEIFTLDSEWLLERLKEVENYSELRALKSHPRFLYLILNQERVISRLNHLQEMNLQCVTLNILNSSVENFQRFVDKGSDRANNNDIVHYLGITLGVDKTVILENISRHQLRHHVSLVTVQRTLKLLLREGYTSDDIIHNIQLTLYPWRLVKDHLSKLLTRPELSARHLLSRGKPYFRHKQLLAFCLYFIERDYHFSGNGIWSDNHSQEEHLPDL